MPLKRYGVLKGSVVVARREDDSDSPHYQVHLCAGSTSYRIAVNVKSMMSPSELLFLVDDRFRHPVTPCHSACLVFSPVTDVVAREVVVPTVHLP
jgi:uncharacterized protein YukJ